MLQVNELCILPTDLVSVFCAGLRRKTIGVEFATTNDAKTNECYNKLMLQRTNAVTKDATPNECYSERCYNKLMLQ